jgi:hypothetical protein
MGLAESAVPMVRRAFEEPLLPGSSPERLAVVLDGPLPEGRFVPPRTWPALLDAPAALAAN